MSISPSESPQTVGGGGENSRDEGRQSREFSQSRSREGSNLSRDSHDHLHMVGVMGRSAASFSPHISFSRPRTLRKGIFHKIKNTSTDVLGFRKQHRDSKEFKDKDDDHHFLSPSGARRSTDTDELRMPSVDPSIDGSHKRPVRVFRTNGTFGTLACPDDATTPQLLQLATRKFFIQDPENYRLLFQMPERTRALWPSDKPLKLLDELAAKSDHPYDSSEAVTDDLSFLGRFVLDKKPVDDLKEAFILKPSRLRIVDWVEDKFPDYVVENADKILTIEMYKCSVYPLLDLAPHAPNIQVCRVRDSFQHLAALPRNLIMFKELQTLDLRNNGLSELEVDFSLLTKLRNLDVSGNSLRTLPASLASCPLKTLYASTNQLREYDIFLPTLEHLDLDYNLVASLGPDIVKCTALRRLHLAYNQFSRFPRQLEYLEKLNFLDLTGNQISQLAYCRALSVRTFKLCHNRTAKDETPQRSREVKVPYFYLPNITTVDISFNGHGFVHNPYMPQLVSLDIRGQNMLVLPDAVIQNVPHLKRLAVGHNGLTSLPSSISGCKNLQYLDVSNNSLTHLPSELVMLSKLQTLNLCSNNLKSLPAFFHNLQSLQNLNISSNLFESLAFLNAQSIESRQNSVNSYSSEDDPLEQQLSKCSTFFGELHTLSVADNRLTDDVLDSLRLVPSLRWLNLSYNDLSEIPPGIFRHLVNLESLYLSGNRLGTLPQEEFEQLLELHTLYLNGNRLHTIPAEFAKLENLQVLDVGDNSLRYNVSNWPFDWNWCFNKRLKYLNFSSNRRLEIKRATQGRSRKEKDLTDLTVLPDLVVLGLIDVTMLGSSVPDQTENTRVRTYGSDLNSFKFGIADTLGNETLGINDLVIDHYRSSDEEALIALIDGQNGSRVHGNRISKLVQQYMPNYFRQVLDSASSIENAMVRTFQGLHAEIGNLILMGSSASWLDSENQLDERDKFSGTGVALCYVRKNTVHLGILGGTQCVVSMPDGNHRVLNLPQVVTQSTELNRVRDSSAIVIDEKINGVTKFTRLIGCYTLGSNLSRIPTYVEYTMATNDILIIASSEFWEFMEYETAADIARSESGDAALAALKLRDLAIAYGCTSRLMVMVLQPHSNREMNQVGRSKRKQQLPQDSLLARLGEEITPPIGSVTLVFTDIRHSTLLWENMPNVMRSAIKTHNSIMRRTIRLMSGYEVKTEGDAFIVAFHSPVEALLWCLTVQQQLLVADWPTHLLENEEGKPVFHEGDLIFQGLRVRMGLHRGRPVCEHDPITGRMDYFGPMVNKTARISSVANGGQIMVSQDLLRAISEEEPSRLEMLDDLGYVSVELGELKLKGIENPEHLYSVYPKSLKSRAAYEWEEPAVESAAPGTFAPRPPSMPSVSASQSVHHLGAGPHSETNSRQASYSESDDPTFLLYKVCLRLEYLCNALQTGGKIVSRFLDNIYEENLEMVVTRIENAVAQLTLQLTAPHLEFRELLALLAK